MKVNKKKQIYSRLLKSYIKVVFKMLMVSSLLTGCDIKPFDQMLKESRENFAKEMEIHNAGILAWEYLVDSLYKIADTNHVAFFLTIDNLISNETMIDEHRISELHFIKGDIYYRIDSFQKSITEFTAAGVSCAPKYLAARAGAYLKLEQYDSALADLNKAAKTNYDYDWNIGNYYEAIGNRDSAIFYYTQLYNQDTIFYTYCKKRINKLKKPETKLFTELVFRDRERKVLLLEGIK